jgi:hypothetical protein
VGTWPPTGIETREWISKYPADQLTRKQAETFRGPYEAAVVASIAALEPEIDAELAAAVDDASTALARFDSELGAVSMPFAAILLRS